MERVGWMDGCEVEVGGCGVDVKSEVVVRW